MEEKTKLRKSLQAQLQKMSKPEYEHLSYKIAQNLFSTSLWQEAKVIGITISRAPEVDTYQIIRKAWEEDKVVVVAKCEPQKRRMHFRVLTAFEQLESVYYGLYEPIVEQTLKVEKEKIDLLIVPGLAFTKSGYRLGFGGGYYDRFMADYQGNNVALAFPLQLLDALPIESHDIPVRQIVTTEEIISTHE
ncbi:5-formyltetrahydrofolate cyclo-ligase [Robertmurraya siralis]|uniref:5-formyltetrahydrofolate cyclo-ligase n=1 Tax=Robertmurraya siralis TaxID=77777 RepID=A0A920BRZ2_9BACI|nr:5-formyltetrahydrofolate cyclo-ligase [Robertmurraya siralis]PAE21814.1 5-formyltetrahydrofolate cyclo-ligase [Bacillus sp. 7504-2]GIN60468.1 5-formyltetrahydrofolate cyclo-ligase [Robertmurraya siralis]